MYLIRTFVVLQLYVKRTSVCTSIVHRLNSNLLWNYLWNYLWNFLPSRVPVRMKLTPKKGQCTICQKFYILYWAQKRPKYNLSKVLQFVLGPKKACVQFVLLAKCTYKFYTDFELFLYLICTMKCCPHLYFRCTSFVHFFFQWCAN